MTHTHPTPEQREAIGNIDQDLPVTAGAGSGKTFVLTHRYFQILAERQATLPEILTITFTDKAANQMKQKIRDLIRQSAYGRTPKDFPPLSKSGVQVPSPDDWRTLLDNFDQAYISTIHGFCARLLKENAIRVGLDPDFSVMDEHITSLRQPQIIRRTVFELINERDDSVAHLLRYFSIYQITDRLSTLLRKRIQYTGLYEFYFHDDHTAKSVGALFDQVEQRFKEKVSPVLEYFASHPLWQEITTGLENLIPSTESDRFYPHWVNLRDKITGLTSVQGIIDQANIWISMQEDLKSKGSQSNWDGADFTELKKKMVRFRTGVLEPALAQFPVFDAEVEQEALRLAQSAVDVYHHTLENYTSWKRQRAYLDYDDLLVKAVEILENSPEILRSYGNQFRHILVDEFQDTSPVQYLLVQLLKQGGDRQSRLFLVGDPKQSIYRFRGTEVSLFEEAREMLSVQESVLSRSFRSQPAILEWIDACFSKVMGTKEQQEDALAPYEQHYLPLEPTRQNVRAPSASTTIQLIEVDKNAEDATIENKLMIEAAHIANWLQNELSNISVEEDGEVRQATYGDVAVLFRRTNYMKQYEYALQLADVPYYSISGSGFFNKQEIRDILNILQALSSAEDEIAAVGALRSGLFGMSDEGLYWLARAVENWYDVLYKDDFTSPESLSPSDAEILRASRSKMQRWRRLKDRYAPDRLIDLICTETGYFGVLGALPNGVQHIRNIEQFIDLAHDFGQSTHTSLGAFVTYAKSLQQHADTEEAPLFFGDQDAVRLMTIHKAKGLEFPIVLIPNIDYTGHNTRQKDFYPEYGWALNWTDPGKPAQQQKVKPFIYQLIRDLESRKDLAESKRLFYVASTRARDYLMLSGVFTGPDGLQKMLDKVDYGKDNWLRWTLGVLNEQGWEPDRQEVRIGSNNVQVSHVSYLDIPHLPSASDLITRESPEQETAPITAGSSERGLSIGEIKRRWNVPARAPELTEMSPSMLPVFCRDPERFFNTYILKLPDMQFAGEAQHSRGGAAFGSLIHNILEMYVSGSPGEPTEIIDAQLANSEFRDSPDLKEEILSNFQVFRDTDLHQQIVEYPCYTEVEFLSAIDDIELSGQIDLLIDRGSRGLVLVDYKTDVVDDEDFVAKVREYLPQLEAYAYGIRQSTGNLPTEVLLYFWQYGAEVPVPIGTDQITHLIRLIGEIRTFIREEYASMEKASPIQ